MSRKAIKIGYAPANPPCPCVYQVVSVKNSTARVPGEILEKSEVDYMCESPAWEVTLVPLHEQGAAR